MHKYLKPAASVALVLGAVVSAQAFAAVDLSADATAMETDLISNLTLIGSALIAAATGAVVFKWAKGMIFG